MKKKMLERVICFLLSVTLLAGSVGLSASAATLKVDPTGQEKHPYSASTLEEMQDLVGTLSYEEYMANFGSEKVDGLSIIPVDILKVIEGNGQVVSENALCQSSRLDYPSLWNNFGDNADKSIYLPAQGFTTWQVEVPEALAGLYYLKVEYFNPETSESSISSIERKLKIDDKIPFDEVSTVKFDKNWQYDNIETVTTEVPGEADDYFVEYTTDDKAYKRITTRIKDGVKTVTTYTLSQDINGNSMSPTPSSLPSWNTTFIKDTTGYYTGYFNFYFSYGSHTITLEAEREPMIIKSIELVPADEEATLPSYVDFLENYKAQGYAPAVGGNIIEIQAEFPDLVSDSSVAPTNDNSSAVNTPISSSAQLYNIIGENSYSSVGQWAAYKFSVTKSGLYNLGMRYNQSTLQGMFVCRTIKISGGEYGLPDGSPSIPFAEAYNTTFNYDKNWQSQYLGADISRTDENGNVTEAREDFLFYFEEGVEYTLYLECSLGTLKNYIQRVEASLAKINSCYLQILQLTGTDPDEYRDYNFVSIMPEVLVTLLEEAVTLLEVKEGLELLCGTNGSHIATLETVAILLNTMGKNNGDDIAVNLSQLKSYLGTLGTWINDSKLGSMKVDSIWIVPAKVEGGVYVTDTKILPKANASFFETCWHEIKSFVNSFFVKYDQMGVTTEIDEEHANQIDVWLATGRDQSQIWRTMIDAHGGFTYNTGAAVSLKLVTAGTLLPSILSGKGPDVYIGLGAADVINYAIRNAIIGIGGKGSADVYNTKLYTYRDADGNYTTTEEYLGEENLTFVTEPFSEVVDGNFADAAMDTVTLLDTTYGIPQTMGFAMMFYRMDVLADLGIEVPESWDQLLSVLPILQSNNMTIGVTYISALDFMIYQLGGSMWKYTDTNKYSSEYAGARIDLDSDVALEAFNFTCRLYTDYSFPVSFDAANRFRTGEIPIIISDYATLYNTLTVYATEIEGLWEFCSLPGSKRADGTFNYDSLATITATIILHGCDNPVAAWQFTQWQTGDEAQSTYGNKMVALIGPSAKYESANLNAINNLSWTASEKEAIMNQMEHMSSIVNYPGSYIITRYTQFAFLDAVNNSVDPIDAMTGYIEAINTEITRKRLEFGLWVPENSEDEPPELEAQD